MHFELKPKMKSSEIKLLKTSLENKKFYLEFGCGGSTVIASESGVESISAVDTSGEWIDRCKEHPSIARRLELGQMKLFHIDVGALKKWGKPASKDKIICWVSYSAGIWDEISSLPDIVLVDGRWRVACGLQALWRCSDDTRILVHDWDKRERYHELLEFAEIEEKAEQLVLLRPKPDRDRGQIAMRALQRVVDYS